MSQYRDHDVKVFAQHGPESDDAPIVRLTCMDCGWGWIVGPFPVSVERDLAVRAREHQLHARKVDLGLVPRGA